MCTENINFKYKNNFTSFGQKTAAFYDNHNLLIVLRTCIFWPQLGLKPRYFALHVTENGKVSINIVPPLDTRLY